MKGDALNPEHSFVAYASGGKIKGDSVDGEAFVRRATDTDGLSVNWVERFDDPRANQLTEISRRVRSRINVRKTGRFAEVKASSAAAAVAELIETFSVVEDPLESEGAMLADESHSLLMGLPERNENEHQKAQAVGDAIATAVTALHEPVLE